MIETLDNATRRRTTLVLHPPRDLDLELARPGQVGALPLFELEPRHQLKPTGGHAPPAMATRGRLAVIWTRQAVTVRLVALGPAWSLAEVQGRALEVPPVDLSRPVVAAEDSRRAMLEALAVAVDHRLEVTITRADGPRRLRGVVLNLAAQVLVAEDLDRQAPRSFRLADLVAVELEAGQVVPTWDPLGGRYVR